ncbi:MAG: LysR family transcriptional regulator [Solirubrobacteraceae bacterium]|nr:LysR family transcriptional regulator [Solirubrobacteraceae bacterium]
MTPLPELRLLRSFGAVCDAGSLSRAAGELHISQQALSQQLRQLEGLLGVELIERTNRGAVPTPAGRTLLVEARKVLIAAERAVERTLQTAAGHGGSLRLGHTFTTSSDLVPVITERLAATAPRLQLTTIEMLARDLPGALERGEVDVALIPHADHGDHIDTSPAATAALCAAVAAGDPLADEPHVSLQQLSGRTVHLWPRDVAPGYYDAVVEAFASAAIAPVLDTSVVGNAVWARIARGPGVGVIAVSQAPSLPRAIATIPIVPAPPPMRIDLTWRRGDPPASLATIQHALD